LASFIIEKFVFLVMKSSVIFATLSLCFVAASAQIIIPAPCQDTTIEQEFDLPAVIYSTLKNHVLLIHLYFVEKIVFG